MIKTNVSSKQGISIADFLRTNIGARANSSGYNLDEISDYLNGNCDGSGTFAMGHSLGRFTVRDVVRAAQLELLIKKVSEADRDEL